MNDLDAMRREQERLAALVLVGPNASLPAAGERRVLALDVQYAGDRAHVAGSLWAGAQEVATWVGECGVQAPYRPGYFCFREGPPLLALVRRLLEDERVLDLLVVDGHGLAHPRRFGAACWLGVSAGLPAVGCAKESLLPVQAPVGPARGSTAPVLHGGEVVGTVLRTQDGVNPLFVSVGHRLDLAGAQEAILSLPGEFRLPEPLRRADHAARMRARGALRPEDGEDLGLLD